MVQASFHDAHIYNPGAGGSGVPGLMSFGVGPAIPPVPPAAGAPALVGGIVEWGSAAIPANWLLCDGTLYAQAAQPALFAVIGLTFIQGGDPPGFFRVPDCRGRIVIGAGSALPLGFHDGLVEAARNPIDHGHAGNIGYDNTAVDAGTGVGMVLPHFWTSDTFLVAGTFMADPGGANVADGGSIYPVSHAHLLVGGTGTGWGGNHETADLAHAHPDGGTLNNLNNWPTHIGLNYIICAG